MKTRNRVFSLLVFLLVFCVMSQTGTGAGNPEVVPIGTLNRIEKDNTPATIEGKIVRQVKKDEFILQDDTGSILVDVEREVHFGVRVGQKIRTSGKLDINLFGSREFKAKHITVLEDVADLPEIDPSTLTNLRYISSIYLNGKDGETVTVSGRIVRRLDAREIMIRDESGGEIIVDANYSQFGNIPLNVGKEVVVTGELDVYWGGPWLEIEAQRIEMVKKKIPREEPPIQLNAIPISEVVLKSQDGDFVTVTGTILRRIDRDDYLFQDDTGTITVDADPKRFSHHGLAEGRMYTVTGRLKVGIDGQKEILALIITAQRGRMAEEPQILDMEPEIPISSVYYEREKGEKVTVAGSIIREVPPNDFILQDDTGSIVIDIPEGKFEKLDLTIGSFVIVQGTVDKVGDTVNEIDAIDVSVRKRPGE